MSWTELKELSGAFTHALGKRVVRVEREYLKVPPGNDGWIYGWDFEAVEFDDGSWIAIDHQPGSRGWSEWTPGEPGAIAVFVYAPDRG